MLRTLIISLALVALPYLSASANPAVAVDDKGIAIKGYDAVAYHTDGKAVQGSAAHTHTWQDAVWHFVSAANRDKFAAMPEALAPAYGGYCAFCIAVGRKVAGDPEAWAIHNGRVYLHVNAFTRDKWAGDAESYIAESEDQWELMADLPPDA